MKLSRLEKIDLIVTGVSLVCITLIVFFGNGKELSLFQSFLISTIIIAGIRIVTW